MTDVNVIENYISYLVKTKNSSSNTLAAYKRDLDVFCSFLSQSQISLLKATSENLTQFKGFLTDSGKSVATVSRTMSCVRSLYKYLVATNTISYNPGSQVKNDKSQKKFFEILTESEVDRLIALPDVSDFKGVRDKAMLEIMYATGIKVSELISLDVSDINLKLNFVRCHSENDTKHERVVLLYPAAVKAIQSYLNGARKYFVINPNEQALFVNVNGERMTRQGFWKILKSYAAKANIDKTITPHTLRHSFAAHLLQNGANIVDIKDILGHVDVSSTQVYAQYLKSKLQNSYLKFHHRA